MKKILLFILLFNNAVFAQKAPVAKTGSPKAVEYFNKGTVKAQENDLREALKYFDKALKENPDYMEALYNRGVVRIKMEDYQGAIDDLSAVLKIKPGFAGAMINRAAARGYLKDYSGAQADLDGLLESKPNFAKAYTMRAQMKAKLKDREGACADFGTAIGLGDKSAEKLSNILCSGKYALGHIIRKSETYTMDWPDTSSWKAADTVKVANTILYNFTKGTETIKNYTELATIVVKKGITNVPVESAMKEAFAGMQAICPQAKLTQIDKNEDDEFPWIQFVIECPGKSGFYQLVQGNTAQFLISVNMKVAAIDAETRDAWKDIMSKGKVEYK